MKTIAIDRFLGINNRLPDTEMKVSTRQMSGQWLRSAVNVEVDDAGLLRRRNGTALINAQSSPHSLFKLDDTHYFMVRASVLYAITLPSYTELSVKALTSNAAMSYVTLGADTYFSNGTDVGRITANVAYPIGLPTPAMPSVAAIGGSLLRGWYQVSIAYYNSVTGEEGGVSPASRTEIANTGALRVTLPGTTTGADKVNVYVSGANGGPCLYLTQVPAATATYDITALGTGRVAPQRFEAPLPAGVLFHSNGRLCSIVGSIAYVGPPFRYGYMIPATAPLRFKDAIALAVENEGGTYIATTAGTFWFPGDLGNVQDRVSNPTPHGAVPGTVFTIPDRKIVGWFGTLGTVFADTQGQITEVMNDNIDLTPPASGSAVVLQTNGYMRVVSCGWCSNVESKATTQYSGWDFTSVTDQYGTKADGIYSLVAKSAVVWSFGLGKTDFGSEEQKRLPTAYIGAACPSQIEMTVGYVDERGNAQSYTYLTRGACEALKQQRIDSGRGIRASWFDLSFGNSPGDEATIATLSFLPYKTMRRI